MEENQTDQASSDQPTSLSKLSNDSKPEAAISLYAAERARLMFGCYRKGDANDPDVYVAALTLVLSGYPEHVIRAMTNPDSGLPSKYTFLPSVAEVKKECEEYIRPEREYQARQVRINQQLRERAEFDGKLSERIFSKAKPETREEEISRTRVDGTRPTYEQLISKLPDNLRIPSMRGNGGKNGTMTEADKAKAMAQLASVGISKEVFDAIPDQKDYDWKKPALNIPKSTHKPHQDDPRAEVQIDGSLKFLDEKEANPFD